MTQPDVTTAAETATEAAVAVADAGTVAKPEEREALDPDWPYDRIEYKGDRLAIRKAKMQALMAYQLSSGKYIPMEKQNDASGLFIVEHLGPDSYDRIMERMLDPDDVDYDMKSFAELMGLIVRASIEQITADRKAEEARQKALASGS